MLKYIVIGGSLAFAAAVQPGPLQVYFFSRVATIGWRRTLPASLSPLLSDGPIALLALLIIGRLSSQMQGVLRGAGGLFLLYLAWNVFRQWRSHSHISVRQQGKVPRTLLEATLVNILNPSPYLGWALVLGPVVLAAWQEAPGAGAAVIIAFYTTMVAMNAVLIFAFGSARLVGPKLQYALLPASGVLLTCIGIYQIVLCVQSYSAT